MWKHDNFINLQLYAPPRVTTAMITVNGAEIRLDIEVFSWENNLSALLGWYTLPYTVVEGKVIWENGQTLQYNGIDVLGTDKIIANGIYTTDGGGAIQ